MQLIVSGGQLYEVEPWRSGFYLKAMICEREGYYDPDSFSLSCNGKPLKDDSCLDQQGVGEISQICLHKSGKGGINKWTVIFWLAVIVYTVTLFTLMGTGVLNMIAYLYAFFFKWGTDYILKKLLGFFKGDGIIACIRMPLTWLTWCINFIIKHSIVFIFVYTALAALSYPLFGIRFKDHCQALFLSKKVGVISAVLYIFIYGLLNVPNLLYNAAMLVTDLTPTTKNVLTPALQAQKDAVDRIKYFGFYAIPFVGQGIQQLHFIMSSIVVNLYETEMNLEGINCVNNISDVAKVVKDLCRCLPKEKGSKSYIGGGTAESPPAKSLLAKSLPAKSFPAESLPSYYEAVCNKYKKLLPIIKDNKMEDMLGYAYMGLDPDKYAEIKKEYENAGFFTKIDILGITKIGKKYFNATASQWIICSILDAINDTDHYFNYVGDNVDSIVDTMKMGNIAGMFATVGYAILLIIAMLWPGFLGYL